MSKAICDLGGMFVEITKSREVRLLGFFFFFIYIREEGCVWVSFHGMRVKEEGLLVLV